MTSLAISGAVLIPEDARVRISDAKNPDGSRTVAVGRTDSDSVQFIVSDAVLDRMAEEIRRIREKTN